MKEHSLGVFLHFAESHRCGIDDAIIDRLSVGDEITSIDQLMHWAQERWPVEFHRDPQEAGGLKLMFSKLWADFLEWKEADLVRKMHEELFGKKAGAAH